MASFLTRTWRAGVAHAAARTRDVSPPPASTHACAITQAMEAADGEEAARQQVEALFHRLSSLTAKLTEAEDERRAELEPEIKAAKDDVALLQSQLEGERAKADAAQREAADIGAKLETVGPRKRGGGACAGLCAFVAAACMGSLPRLCHPAATALQLTSVLLPNPPHVLFCAAPNGDC